MLSILIDFAVVLVAIKCENFQNGARSPRFNVYIFDIDIALCYFKFQFDDSLYLETLLLYVNLSRFDCFTYF